MEKYIIEVFEKNGYSVTEEQALKFVKYYEMLVEKNKVMNLTAITEFKEVVVKHFLDSIAAGKYMDLSGKKSLIDVGTGAGFPGIPLKIMYPELKVVLLDSLNKRVNFLNEVIEALSMTDITAIHGRAEEIAKKPEYREQFDYCVSRAVANMNSLSEICIPFVKKGGKFVPYKSVKGQEELSQAAKAIKLFGGDEVHVKVVSFRIGDEENGLEMMDRNLILIKKINATPKKYPRKPGTPFKDPIV